MKKIFEIRSIVTLFIGVILGYFLYDFRSVTIDELSVYSSSDLTKGSEIVKMSNDFGVASFDGIWKSATNEKIVNSINSVYIDCWLDDNYCKIAQSNIIPDDWLTKESLYTNSISYYKITQWSDKGEITAENKTTCENQVLKASISTGVVTLTESVIQNTENVLCTKDKKPTALILGSK